MENYRSMSCREGRNKSEIFAGNNSNNNSNSNSTPKSMQDLRSYSSSSSYAPSYMQCSTNNNKKSKAKPSLSSSSSTKGSWSLSDPEIQRKKRVVSYKVYAVEGKMKGSFRKSFRWFKSTCSHVVHGIW